MLLGAYLLATDRIRTGRIWILLGSGTGFVILVLHLARNLVSEEFPCLMAVLPAILGVAFSIAAQWRAKPAIILP